MHLIATPHDTKALGRLFQRVHSDYDRSVHLRLRRTRHLWQARYHSVPLDEEHFWASMVYVEQNPLRAGLVGDPTHLDLGLYDAALFECIREGTVTGRPIGCEDFLKRLELEFAVEARRKFPGRQPLQVKVAVS